jgi:hypothetical protein
MIDKYTDVKIPSGVRLSDELYGCTKAIGFHAGLAPGKAKING